MTRSFRYALILVLFALGTGLAAVAGWRYARTSSPVNGPIVLISIDSLRADRLAAYGSNRVPTPAVDRLAADGVVFERAYTHAPQTLPAHAALLSGRLPFDTGVRDEVGLTFPEDERLLAEMLSERGYETAGIVSSFALRRDTGLARGFKVWDDELPDAADLSHRLSVHRDGAESERRAERWLSAVGTSRAFLFLHLDEPRAPYEPPSRFSAHAPYDGEVAYVDEIVGHLLAYLEKQQLYDQSTIVLLADHGEGPEGDGAHGEHEHGVLVHDATTRVPLIVKLPASEGAGRRVSDVVQHVDLVPTILDLAKAPSPRGLRGRSLEPLLKGRQLEARVAYSESMFAARQFGWSPVASVTDGRYRLVRTSVDELYDRDADPDAKNNLIDRQPAVADRLREALEQLVGEAREVASRRVDRALAPASTVADRERFMALGFLGPHDPRLGAPTQPDVHPKGKLPVVAGYREALAHVAARRWAPALGRLRAIARDEPGLLDVWMSLARVAERAERYETAVDAYRHILGRAPGLTQARLGLATVLVKAGRFEEARKQAELASADPDDDDDDAASKAAVHARLAQIAVETHNPGSARVHAQRVLELDSRSAVPTFIEGRLLFERERYEDALPYFEEAATLVAQSGSGQEGVHYLRGVTLLRLDRQAEAEAAFLAEIASIPESLKARAALTALYHAQGREDDATTAVTALTNIVNTPSAYSAAARLWTVLGDRDRAAAARAAGRRALAAGPTERDTAQ